MLYVVGLRTGERGIYGGVEVEEWRVGVWVSDAQAFLEGKDWGEARIWDRRIWGGYEKKRAGILRLNKGVGGMV